MLILFRTQSFGADHILPFPPIPTLAALPYTSVSELVGTMEALFNASYCIAVNTPNSPPYLVTLLLPYTCLIWFFYDALVILVFLAMYFLFAFTGD